MGQKLLASLEVALGSHTTCKHLSRFNLNTPLCRALLSRQGQYEARCGHQERPFRGSQIGVNAASQASAKWLVSVTHASRTALKTVVGLWVNPCAPSILGFGFPVEVSSSVAPSPRSTPTVDVRPSAQYITNTADRLLCEVAAATRSGPHTQAISSNPLTPKFKAHANVTAACRSVLGVCCCRAPRQFAASSQTL